MQKIFMTKAYSQRLRQQANDGSSYIGPGGVYEWTMNMKAGKAGSYSTNHSPEMASNAFGGHGIESFF